MSYSDGGARVSFSELINGTFSMIGRHLRPIAVYALAVGVPAAALTYLGSEGAGNAIELIAGLVAGFFLLEHVLGAEGQLAGSGRERNILGYVGAAILVGIGVVFGLVLLIVPGLILLARWSLASGLIVADGAPAMAAMRESWERTRASQWSIIGFYLVMFLIFAAAGGLIGAVAGGGAVLAGSDEGPLLLVTSLVSQAASACGMMAIPVLLRHLRPGEEGLDEVFA